MTTQDRLELWLSTVGLLRAKLSLTMKHIHETRQSCKEKHSLPPDELIPLMAEAQELFAEMLKSGEFLSTARDNLELKTTETFDAYLEEWALSQGEHRFRKVGEYLTGLSQASIQGLELDPEIWEEGLMLIEQALNAEK